MPAQGWDVLPLRTRIALLVLLGMATCVLLLLWAYQDAVRSAGLRPDSESRVAATGLDPEGRTAAFQPADADPTAANIPVATQPAPPPVALTPAAIALAEIEVLTTLAANDPTFDAKAAIVRLKPHTQSADETVRTVSTRALQPILAALDVRARTIARTAAETAEDLAEEQDFPAALQTLQSAVQALPREAPWAANGATKLQALSDTIARRRADEKAKALADFEAEWRRSQEANTPPAPRMAALLQHRDPAFRQEAAAIKARVEDEWRTKRALRQETDAVLRIAWLEFFARLSTTIAEGDVETAAKLCQPSEQPTLLKGGVSEPQKVLEGCAADVAGIRKLYDAALAAARTQKTVVSLAMRRGHVEGTLDGVEGRQLFVALGGGARVGVKIENVTAAGLLSILKEKDWAGANLLPSLWALSAYENAAEASTFMPKTYASAKQPLPPHWQERFTIEKSKRLDEEVTKLLRKLDAASATADPEKVKAALDAVRPVLTTLEEFGPLSDARRASIARAEKILNKAGGGHITLQNGCSPAPDYVGLGTDQISQYRESANRTDVGVQYGLKVGAAGGLQRALIKFEGLEAALGKARVKRAVLELYQIDSPQSSGAIVGLFRLKRPWVPDAGTWMSYDSGHKGCDWSLPGASSDADVERNEDAKMVLDDKKNLWRSWDITAYVQDVLAGKAQNFGFLLRVINGEPDYHVRFYPETDLDALKDSKLRPRLVLDVETP